MAHVTNLPWFDRLLCSDARSSLPDGVNDHCWLVSTTQSQPSALSVITTYGLRASHMQVFPSFTCEDQTVQDPAQFHTQPLVQFHSTNYLSISFSPFRDIEVLYEFWVPASQLIMGEITCTNRSEKTKSLQVDWLVELSPLSGGSPMKHSQYGLSTVLQGECADLFPVFYLSGDTSPSRSTIPGLSTRFLLLPAASKRSLWVLASLSTSDTSFQLARQYSSRSMEIEKLRVEMADKLDQAQISVAHPILGEALELSRVRANQLLMPPTGNFKFPTFVNARGPDTGFYPRKALLEINPEWSGQTFPQIWLMAQTLLPGRPALVRGFIMNMLTRRPTQSGIDHRVGLNGALTGHTALPLAAQLVADLHTYLNDLPWLEEIYPDLLTSVKLWITDEPDGSLRVSGLAHPIQLGLQLSGEDAEISASNIWMKLGIDNNLLVTSLLIRELTDLIQVSRWLGKTEEIAWLENTKARLTSQLLSIRDDHTGLFHNLEQSPDYPAAGKPIHVYKHNGLYNPRRKFHANNRVYLRITGEERIKPGFSCTLNTRLGEKTTALHITSSDLIEFGNTRLFVSEQVCDFLESLEIRDLSNGLSIEVGLPDTEEVDLTQLLTLYAGVLSSSQADQMLRHLHVRDFFGSEGLSLLPSHSGETALPVPFYLAGMIVEGLLRYDKIYLADQVFHHHFITRFTRTLSHPGLYSKAAVFNLEDLVPARLFLKLRGVVRLTDHEVILSHFIKQKRNAVTVQYNRIELRLKPFLAEIHTQTGEVIYLNRAGPNRVLLD